MYYQAPPPTLVNPPTSNPADLISATAADDGTNITFSAKTVDLNNPATDPNWHNNTYIGWGIDPTFSGTAKYYAYFQLDSAGHLDGELAYASNDAPVSCNVSLTFNTDRRLPGTGAYRLPARSQFVPVVRLHAVRHGSCGPGPHWQPWVREGTP